MSTVGSTHQDLYNDATFMPIKCRETVPLSDQILERNRDIRLKDPTALWFAFDRSELLGTAPRY